MTRLRHQIHAEYQPTREYNFGVILNFDTINVENGNGSRDGLSEFSDQYLFAEYRFEDQVGHSIGAGLVVKIPFYKNPSVRSITDAGKDLTPIFGDGQTDYTLYLTGEIWPDNDIRIRADLGYTLRSEGFSDEIPYMVDVSLRDSAIPDWSLYSRTIFSRKW